MKRSYEEPEPYSLRWHIARCCAYVVTATNRPKGIHASDAHWDKVQKEYEGMLELLAEVIDLRQAVKAIRSRQGSCSCAAEALLPDADPDATCVYCYTSEFIDEAGTWRGVKD